LVYVKLGILNFVQNDQDDYWLSNLQVISLPQKVYVQCYLILTFIFCRLVTSH